MLKNRIELVPEQINTVEDLIKVLMKVPAKYIMIMSVSIWEHLWR